MDTWEYLSLIFDEISFNHFWKRDWIFSLFPKNQLELGPALAAGPDWRRAGGGRAASRVRRRSLQARAQPPVVQPLGTQSGHRRHDRLRHWPSRAHARLALPLHGHGNRWRTISCSNLACTLLPCIFKWIIWEIWRRKNLIWEKFCFQFFRPVKVLNILVLFDSHTGRALGEADAEFLTHQDALEAMKKDKQHIGGCPSFWGIFSIFEFFLGNYLFPWVFRIFLQWKLLDGEWIEKITDF